MATAVFDLASGTKVTIEGGQDEVAALLSLLEASSAIDKSRPRKHPALRRAAQGTTPTALILEAIAEGFFQEPRELGDLNRALRAKGHFYPTTTLSPALLRLIRRKQLRRMKEGKRWKYVT